MKRGPKPPQTNKQSLVLKRTGMRWNVKAQVKLKTDVIGRDRFRL